MGKKLCTARKYCNPDGTCIHGCGVKIDMYDCSWIHKANGGKIHKDGLCISMDGLGVRFQSNPQLTKKQKVQARTQRPAVDPRGAGPAAESDNPIGEDVGGADDFGDGGDFEDDRMFGEEKANSEEESEEEAEVVDEGEDSEEDLEGEFEHPSEDEDVELEDEDYCETDDFIGMAADLMGVGSTVDDVGQSGVDGSVAFEGTVQASSKNSRSDTPSTILFYRARFEEAIHDHTSTKLVEWICFWVKERKAMSEAHIESIYKGAVSLALPKNHICPTSWRMCRDVLGVEDYHKHEYHFCSCATHRYDPIPYEDYAKQVGDRCPRCDLSRFETDKNGRLRPRAWCFYPGLKEVISKLMFANPNFTEARSKGRVDKPHCFYGSQYCKDIEKVFEDELRVEGVMRREDTSPYSIFYDGFGPLKNKVHSTGVVLLHCEDITPEKKGRNEFAVVLMIIPGPRKPKWGRLYMELIAEDFHEYGWLKNGMEIRTAVKENEDGSLETLPPFMHRPILIGLDADHPAGLFVAEMPEGSQGYRGCLKCKCCGKKLNTSEHGTCAMCYPGYVGPHTITQGRYAGESYQIGVADDARMLKKADYDEAIKAVKDDPTKAKFYGVNGGCVFIEMLPYLSYSTFFRLPSAHNLLLGNAKSFFRNILRWKAGGEIEAGDCGPLALPISTVKKIKEMLDKANSVVVTVDFNRPFTGHKSLGSWTCEDWLRYIELYSCFIREDIIGVSLPFKVREMWHCLRNATLHILHGTAESDYGEEVREESRQNLLEFAKMVEESDIWKLLSGNLHRANCWIPDQELLMGLVAFMIELWGERGLRPLKNESNAKSLRDVDKTYCNLVMRNMAVKALEAQLLHRVVGKKKNETVDLTNRHAFDTFDADQECGLQGRGRLLVMSNEKDKNLSHAIVTAFRTELEADARDGDLENGWKLSDLDVAEVDTGATCIYIHDRAFIHRTQTVHSKLYKRNISRESYLLQVRFVEVGGEKKYVGEAAMYARLVRGDKEGPLRIALCNFYPYLTPLVVGVEVEGGVEKKTSAALRAEKLGRQEEILRAVHKGANHKWSEDFVYPIRLERIDTKLMHYVVEEGDSKKLFCMTYNFNSNV